MRALVIEEPSGDLKIGEVPLPEPAAGEVRVRVAAASLNGFDLSVASGRLHGMMKYRFPVVIGKDFAGTVDAVGEGVTGFAVGDRVFGVVMKSDLHDGSLGEFVTVPTAIGLARVPDGVDDRDAGALGLAGTAALNAVEAASLSCGETVLISGATGGVGSIAVQLASDRGARVIATARGQEQASFVRDLGAEQAVDHRDDVPQQVRALVPEGVDAVLHFAGDAGQLLGVLKPGGRLSSTLGFTQEHAGGHDATVHSIMATPDAETLTRLGEAVASGKLRVPVQRTYDLDDAPTAASDFSTGTVGKLAITVARSD